MTPDNAKDLPEISIVKDPELEPVRKMIQACMQCGTCTGSCVNAFAMDYTPRKMWRLVQLFQADRIFESKTFMLCSSCYYCTLRCPRGLPLTRAMQALKQIAARKKIPLHNKSVKFYQSFMESVRRHGRVREMEFMTLFFLAMKNPLLPFKFMPLGIRLMGKGKVSIEIPSRGKGVLEKLFQKVEALEADK